MVVATPFVRNDASCSLSASAGVFHPSRFRGRVLRMWAIAKNSPFDSGRLKNLSDIEEPTIDWLNWYKNRRLHSALGYLAPAAYEYESNYYAI